MFEISPARRVEEVVRAACRRRRMVLAVEHLAVAVGLMLAGAIALLIAGTQVLAWWWLLVLGVVGVAVGLRRVRGGTVSEYRVAQIVDRQCRLNDSLSTAWFLLSQKERENDPIARFQIEHAARLAAALKTSRAFPMHGGRNWALTGALAGVVFGLFAVRYLVTSSLDLRPALIRLPFAAVVEQSEQTHQSKTKQIGRNLGGVDRQIADPQAAAPQDAENTDGGAAQEAGRSDKGVAEASGRGPKQEKSVGQGEAPGNSEQANGQPGKDGLLDKMKDALSSLMAKMRPNGSPEKASQSGQPAPQEESSGKQNAAANHGEQSEPRDSQTQQQQSAKAQAQGQTTERRQSAQGQDPGQSPEKGNDSHSGIGRQNGEKELKDAEALRAMGRLEEIIGKRSASVTGDMMVETPSGKQQLKTAYSQRGGQHADLGGEINRDEIPLADQAYVREYMELVRKQAKAQ